MECVSIDIPYNDLPKGPCIFTVDIHHKKVSHFYSLYQTQRNLK